MSDKPRDRCPCGGIILADTEDWKVPLCYECYRFGGLEQELVRERARNAKLREALEFYSKRENFTLIFDNENDSRAEVYEKYKKYSIGDFSVRAIEALAETEGKA